MGRFGSPVRRGLHVLCAESATTSVVCRDLGYSIDFLRMLFVVRCVARVECGMLWASSLPAVPLTAMFVVGRFGVP